MLKEFPKKEIINIFQRSFDGLHEMDKEIFLHIGSSILIERSLLKDHDSHFFMYDLLQKMG